MVLLSLCQNVRDLRVFSVFSHAYGFHTIFMCANNKKQIIETSRAISWPKNPYLTTFIHVVLKPFQENRKNSKIACIKIYQNQHHSNQRASIYNLLLFHKLTINFNPKRQITTCARLGVLQLLIEKNLGKCCT